VHPDDHSAAIVCMPILSGPLTDFAPPVVLRYKAEVNHRASSLSLLLYDMFRSLWFDDLIDRVETVAATRPQNFLPCVLIHASTLFAKTSAVRFKSTC
jgi:hypothetical protein